ncbi:MAG: ADOP family duplicated permease [Candidatus Acidiferrum sp.]
MRRLRAWSYRLSGLFGKERRDHELSVELESHVQLHVDDNLRKGMTPAQARREALMKLGGIEQTKENYRDRRGLPVLETLIQDLRFAVRMLRKSPSFTAVAVLTLALGIGANTAIFSVVNGVLLKPLPYPQPERLVSIFLHGGNMERSVMGNADFLALEQRQQAFEHVAAFSPSSQGFTLTGLGAPQMIPGTSVTSYFFSVLGVRPALGRAFLPEEGKPGGSLSVVVSRGFWEQYLHADPAAVGRSITLDGKSYAVIGVLPPDFHFGPHNDLWPVLQLQPARQRPPYWLMPIGRLKPGVSAPQAAADASRIAKQVQQQFPRSEQSTTVIVPMKEVFVGDVGDALLILLGAVGFVLLIAVVNVANLQLSRSGARGHEMAIRVALGAGRSRLVWQLLTESLVLSISGAALGLVVAKFGVRAMLALNPDLLPRMEEITVDGRVLLFTAVIAAVTGILFGLAPALRVAAYPVGESLKESGRGASSNRGTRRIHNALVVAEFSLALVVLTGAGLLIRTLFQLEAASPGFQSAHIMTALISLPKQRYSSATQIVSFYEQLLERLKNSPRVEGAAIALSLPPNLLELTNPFHLEGESIAAGQSAPAVPEVPISSGYFEALGVPLLRGRYFSEEDRAPGTHVLIINQYMAQRYFPGQDPLGKRVQTGEANPKADWYTIVGVAGNVKYEGLGEKDEATMYVPYFDSGWCPWFVHSLYIVVRSKSAPESVASSAQSVVWSLDNQLPLSHVRTMDQLLYESVASSRFRAALFGIFALLALALAMIGIFGVMAHSVSQRAHEIGIRMALGAQRKSVMSMVLRQGAALAVLGVFIGIAASLALSRLLKGLLFGVLANDPLTIAGVALLVLGVALAACYVPARRAMRVDPMIALRYE